MLTGISAGDLDRYTYVRLLVGESFLIAAQERGCRYKRKTQWDSSYAFRSLHDPKVLQARKNPLHLNALW